AISTLSLHDALPICKFYAAIRRHGFFSSTDGINWTRLANQPGGTLLSITSCPDNMNSTTCPIYRGEFAVVPGRNEMYVWFMDVTATGEVNRAIWQSKDGGNSWTQISTITIDACGDPGSDGCGVQQGEYNLELAAVPNCSTATDLYPGAVLPLGTAANSRLHRSKKHTSELQSRGHLVCRHLLGKK